MKPGDLDAPWSVDGEWSISPRLDNSVSGTLHYEPNSGLQLKLSGSLREQYASKQRRRPFARVYGSVENFGPSTLLDAYTNRSSIGSGGARTVLVARDAILGLTIRSPREERFTDSFATVGNLEEWLDWRALEMDYEALAINSTQRTPIIARVHGLAASIKIGSQFESANDGWHHLGLMHSLSVEITADTAQPLDWHENVHSGIRDLVTLFTGHPSWFRRIGVRRNGQRGLVVGHHAVKARPIMQREMFLRWDDAGLDFEPMLNSWFQHRVDFEAAHDLLFGTRYREMPYAEFAFLAAAQALEPYAKAPLSTSQAKKLEYVDCVERAIDKIAPATRRSLIANRARFVEKVKATRNYYTHYSRSWYARAYHGLDLHHISERVRLLLTLAFMGDIGVEDRRIRKHALTSPLVAHQLKWRG